VAFEIEQGNGLTYTRSFLRRGWMDVLLRPQLPFLTLKTYIKIFLKTTDYMS